MSAAVVDENPLTAGLERLPARSTALVIFGATGDLARRKLLPALYNLAHDGALPERFLLAGVARGDLSDDEFRALAAGAIPPLSRRGPGRDDPVDCCSTALLLSSPGGFDDLRPHDGARRARAGRLRCRDDRRSTGCFYLSTAPDFFGVIVDRLGEPGCSAARAPTPGRDREAVRQLDWRRRGR